MMTLLIVDGCIESINFETHKRGKNWVAIVTSNKTCPGGLEREFLDHGSKGWYKIPDAIKVGDVLEFGGDYYSGSGHKNPSREYVKVLAKAPRLMVVSNPVKTFPQARDSEEKANLSCLEASEEDKLAALKTSAKAQIQELLVAFRQYDQPQIIEGLDTMLSLLTKEQ